MNMKRMRGRNHRPNGGGGGNNGGGFRNQQNGIPLNRNHVFDSSGPEMRVRGTAQQLYEKYQQLARDSFSNGDRVTGEAYYQHAEHYFRIISAINQAQGQPPQVHSGQGQPAGQHGQGGQGSYQNPNQGGHQGQERNGFHAEQNGQQNGHYGNQNRRFEQNNGERRPAEVQQDLQLGEPAPQGEPVRHEARQENRPAPVEGRPNEGRSFEPRRNEHGGQRNRPDFQRNDRNNNDRAERYREAPAVDTRIDISSALEAELAASVAEPDESLPVNLVAREIARPVEAQPVLEARPAEARAIPIIPDAPPPAVERPVKSRATEAETAEAAPAPAPAPAAPAPKPRGRPRTVKAAPKE